MSTTISTKYTEVAIGKNQKITYERRKFLFFTWYKQIRADTIDQDLVINTEEKFARVFVNGKEVQFKS